MFNRHWDPKFNFFALGLKSVKFAEIVRINLIIVEFFNTKLQSVDFNLRRWVKHAALQRTISNRLFGNEFKNKNLYFICYRQYIVKICREIQNKT